MKLKTGAFLGRIKYASALVYISISKTLGILRLKISELKSKWSKMIFLGYGKLLLMELILLSYLQKKVAQQLFLSFSQLIIIFLIQFNLKFILGIGTSRIVYYKKILEFPGEQL